MDQMEIERRKRLAAQMVHPFAPGQNGPTMPQAIGGWAKENPLDAAALATSPIPVVGDAVGLAADVKTMYDEPSLANAGWLGLGMAAPFVGGTTLKAGKDAMLQAMEARRPANAPSAQLGGELPDFSPITMPPTGALDMNAVLDARAAQMEIKDPKKRVLPSGENPLFETTPEAYTDKTFYPPQIKTPVPRAPDGKKLPKGDRARALVDRTDAIAEKLASKAAPHLGTPAQFFYHTGPVKKKIMEIGFTEEQANSWLQDFAQYYAATSPRTETAFNLRNSTLAMAKDAQGIPMTPPRNGDGMNEKGYPMMLSDSGIHGQLLNRVRSGEGIDYNTNPKPATFGQNTSGNLQGVTVDTHAVRGVLLALNEIEPGGIPEAFILPKYREAYKKDPTKIDAAKWVDDTIGKQVIDGKEMQTEYAVFSDIYERVAEKLGVSPAEAQSLGWFGSGSDTNLGSELKTVVDLLDDRIDVTAQLTGASKEDVLRALVRRQIPLASLMAGGSAAALTMGRSGSAEAATPQDRNRALAERLMPYMQGK